MQSWEFIDIIRRLLKRKEGIRLCSFLGLCGVLFALGLEILKKIVIKFGTAPNVDTLSNDNIIHSNR